MRMRLVLMVIMSGACSSSPADDGPDADTTRIDANTSSPQFAACPFTQTDPNRDCGWVSAETFSCTPGVKFRVACSSTCGLGTCTGDTVLRVCAGGQPCSFTEAFGSNDSSSCGAGTCAGDDCCSEIKNDCPSSGTITVLWGPFSTDMVATCDLVLDACSTTAGGCP